MLQQRLLMAILVSLLGGLPAAQPSPQPTPTTPQAVTDWTQDLHQGTPVSTTVGIPMLTLLRPAN